MKKSILLFVLVAVATVVNAAPRFGVIAEQNSGVGAFISDDSFNAQLTFFNKSDDADPAITELTSIKVGGNYKIALDSVTALTVGINYQTISGRPNVDVAGSIQDGVLGAPNYEMTPVTYDSNNTLAISAGVERALSSNLVLTAQTDVYSVNTVSYKFEVDGEGIISDDTKTTSIFDNTRIGVAYLF
jgi:hypothetical protein